MNKRIKMGICTLALVIFTQSSVMADQLSDMLQSQKNQLAQDKKALNDIGDKREDMEITIEHLDIQIQGFMSQVEENKKQVAKAEINIKSAEAEVVKAENDVKSQQELVDKRIRAMYINSQAGYIKLLVQSKGISDLVSRVEAMIKIMDFDKKVVETLELKKVELDKKKIVLEEQMDKLLVLKADNEKKLVSLNEASSAQAKLIDELKKQEKVYSEKVNQSQTLVNTTLKQIDAIRMAAPKIVAPVVAASRGTSPSGGAAPISENNIIAYATNFLGVRYVWGGTTPNPGFDCSGFTRYVFAHFGVYLGRTTYDQINNGVAVARNQLQPGDLVLFGSWGNPHHVGIYAGNNTYIHAPRTGDVVKVSAMTRSDFITGRRVR